MGRATKQISVGGVLIGGGTPVSVQSMTNTKTADIEATVSQIRQLAEAGCDIVRLAVPDMTSAKALAAIRERVTIPIVADIHFDYKLAIEASAAGADKIRINPGNIGGEDRVRAVVNACRKRNIPIRVGVNSGSLEKRVLAEYGTSPEAMLESALGHVRLLNKFDFDDICISVKSSNVALTVAAYRLLAERTSYPLHLGVTEAGTSYMGIIKSSIGIGSLLLDGIGDTIRVSLTADPVEEVRAGLGMLKALDMRSLGVNIISCPTCGRTNIDLIALAKEAEARLAGCDKNITVAVMGCSVNGPGEAKEADFGIAGGIDEGVLFCRGKVLKKVPQSDLMDELVRLIERETI